MCHSAERKGARSGTDIIRTVPGVRLASLRGGTVTGGTLTMPTKGAAVSEATFTYKAPTSGTFTNTLSAARSAGTTYSSAAASATR